MRRTRLIRLLLVLMASGTAGTDVYATDWPQFGYDAAHSGFNSAETGYSTDGNAILRHYSLGFTVDSAPIYVGGVTMANGTTKNVLYIDTKNGTIIAIDADSPTLSTLWSNRPTAANGTNSGNGAPSGSPIIDAAHQYVYAFGLDGNVHKYPAGGVTSGSPDIQTGGWPETVTNKPSVEKGAASLSISSVAGQPDYLYVVTDGYDGDGGNYQGHVTAINLADGTQ
ncbi:MAG TPA: hypothetical protein VFB32_10405, partial [Rudaea sp.]|nr:hypothetical protein [Rudaea sp.]